MVRCENPNCPKDSKSKELEECVVEGRTMLLCEHCVPFNYKMIKKAHTSGVRGIARSNIGNNIRGKNAK